MTRGRTLVATAVALLLGAVATSVTGGAVTGGRQPLGDVQLVGFFHQAAWQGTVSVKISPSGRLSRMEGTLPGTCRDKRTGRLVRAGRDGAIGMQFDALPNAVIRPSGAFAFTARVSAASGLTPHTVTVRGTFYGNNALGRVRGRSTTAKYDRYSGCSGDQPFWVKRIS